MDSKTVVVIGGGFAGAQLAQSLERLLPAEWSIALLSRENFITYNPLLPEVVGASLLPGHVIAPLRQMLRRTRLHMVQVTRIDTVERTVHYAGEAPGMLRYDHLVIACGQAANLAIVKGMERHALPLKTLGDALYLRNRAIERLERAELETDPDMQRWLTTFIVIGGGFSGVEVAGGLADFLRASARFYRSIDPDNVRIHVVHGTDRLLPELPQSLGEFTRTQMMASGLDIRLNARAALVDEHGVTLADGEKLPGGTVVCTIGTATNPLITDLPFPKARGRLTVAADMSVPGSGNVWALGDCAAVPNARDGSVSPPTAQFANRQARQLAANIARRIAGAPTRPFAYKPIGQLSAIGHNKAVAELFGLRITGFVAWLLWRGVYILKIPTLGRKVRVFLEWNWAMFFPPDIAHLGYTRRSVGSENGLETAAGKAAA
jgi:NADH:ubiquinone reductase (H+-translocating)